MSKETGWKPGKLWVVLLGLLILPCSLLSLAQDPPAKPESPSKEEPVNVLAELQNKLIEATGGREALEKHSNRRIVAKVLIPGAAIEAAHTGFVSREGMMWESMTIEGYGDFQQGFHGDIAWTLDPINGARVLSGAEKEQIRRGSHLETLLWLDKDFVSAVESGSEKLGAIDCTIFKLKTTSGTEETYWVATETNFLIQLAMTVDTVMGKIPMKVLMSEFKQMEGIWFPHMMEIQQGIQKMQMIIEDVKYNVEPEVVEETIPAEVQAVIDRKKAAEKKATGAKETSPEDSGR